jgi:3-phenylpropionate/trans-cinnamate dioxygenase ferredoxin reductase subunit
MSGLGINAGTLIVGASQAGVQLAATLRELGDSAPIVLVGEEHVEPYQRPPLSKTYLKGGMDASALAFRTADWYRDNDIRVVTGERLVGAARNPDGSGVAVAESGARFPFARLALTTGAVPRRLDLPGTDAAGVHYLRDTRDADRIGAEAAVATHVVVIGGGFIGLEVAAGLRAAGKTLTVLEAAPRLVGRAVSEQTSAFYLDAHRRRGLRIVLDARIAGIVAADQHEGAGQVTGVRLDDETVVRADLVLIGVGVVPRTDLAAALGLEVENGVVVDDRALASDGLTVAAGDCTVMPTPYLRGAQPFIRLESVHNAVEQAKVAAATLLGIEARYTSVPWFWSDQADLKLQIAGLSTGYDQVVLRGDPADESFSVLYFRDGLLLAADSINAPVEHAAIKNALRNDLTIDPERASDTSIPLKQLVTDIEPAGAS